LVHEFTVDSSAGGAASIDMHAIERLDTDGGAAARETFGFSRASSR
jgi:hypothetical protein